MEPLHITEFASKRYFEKINQLPKEQQQQQQHHQHHHHHQHQQQQQQQHDGSVGETSSKFILPIRQAEQHWHEPAPKHADHVRPEKEKEKRGLFGRLRSSKSISSSDASEPPLRRPSFTSVVSSSSIGEAHTVQRGSASFDQLFLALPSELKIQIIALLPLSDVLNLRLASRAWHGMVTLNEVPIVRYQLEHEVPAYAKRLYPISEGSGYTLHYLCGLWHRLHVAAKLAGRMCDWCTKEIFLKTTRDQVAEFAGQRERMYRRLIPLLFTIFHFFENYRKLHLQYIEEHGHGVERTPYTLNPIEVQIMNMYDDRTLLQVHQVFPMVVASFCRRLRPPSYVGRLEKTIRGYLREKPADDVHTAVLCLGGLRQVLRLWEVKGYNTRRGAVDIWYNDISSDGKGISSIPLLSSSPKPAEMTVPTTPGSAGSKDAKTRRGIMSLGRKKSSRQIRDAHTAKAEDTTTPLPTSRSSQDHVPTRASFQQNFIFHTSLAAGMPMGRLEADQYQLLLTDLPILQKLWLSTAEALILDRRIVERSVDIKRNAQVMLELIKEDGVVEEDIWWYGMAATKSIRPPPLEAIEEDPIE